MRSVRRKGTGIIKIGDESLDFFFMFRPDDQNEGSTGRADVVRQYAGDHRKVSPVVRRRCGLDQMEVQKQYPNALEMAALQLVLRIVLKPEAGCSELLEYVQNRSQVFRLVVNGDDPWRGKHLQSSTSGKTKATTAPSNRAGTPASLASGNTSAPPERSMTRLT